MDVSVVSFRLRFFSFVAFCSVALILPVFEVEKQILGCCILLKSS